MSMLKKNITCLLPLLLLLACSKSADELFREGKALMDEDEYTEALVLLEKAMKKAPDNAHIHNAMGVAFLRSNSTLAAVASFNRAIRADSADYKAYYNRGNAKRVLGNDQGAIEDYNRAIGIYPELADAYANRGAIYAKYQDFDHALFDFQYAISLNDKNPLVFMSKGKIELRINNVEDAIFNFKKAIALKKDLAEAWYWMGLAEIARENKAEGCEYLQSAVQYGMAQAQEFIAENCLQ